MVKLTSSQARVMAFIRSFSKQYGFPPTRGEIAQHFKWASINSATQQIGLIAKKGHIKLIPGIARGIVIL